MALVATFAPFPAQLAALGAFVNILGGLFLCYLEQEEVRDRRRTEIILRLAAPLALAPEDDLYPLYLSYCRALTALAEQTDPLLGEIAALKLASVNAQIDLLACGMIVFAGTETWRAVYEQLLAGGSVRGYRSVAWVRSANYWQDPPGRQSMRANFEAVHRRVLIERIAILPDAYWPWPGHASGCGAITPWTWRSTAGDSPAGESNWCSPTVSAPEGSTTPSCGSRHGSKPTPANNSPRPSTSPPSFSRKAHSPMPPARSGPCHRGCETWKR